MKCRCFPALLIGLLFAGFFSVSQSSATTMMNALPYDPLQIFGLTHEQLAKIKGETPKRCDTDASGNNIQLYAYREDWPLLGPQLKVEYAVSCVAPLTVFKIIVHLPAALPRADQIARISEYFGAPEQGANPPSSASLYHARWLKDGVNYDLEDFGGYREMYLTLAEFPSPASYGLPAGTLLIQQAQADVTGDGQKTTILLLGKRFSDSRTFFEKLYLLLKKPGVEKGELLAFPANADGGYQPQMQLCDFTGDKIPEVFTSAPTGGSGGLSNYLIFNVKDRPAKPIFNGAETILPTFSGQFEANYQAKILLKETNQSYTVDLSARKTLYDEAGLYQAGRLLKPTQLWGGGYGLLTPTPTADGVYQLEGIQAVKGLSNVDDIGRIESVIKWQSGHWQLISAKFVPTN
jgi:hypothetical protein